MPQHYDCICCQLQCTEANLQLVNQASWQCIKASEMASTCINFTALTLHLSPLVTTQKRVLQLVNQAEWQRIKLSLHPPELRRQHLLFADLVEDSKHIT